MASGSQSGKRPGKKKKQARRSAGLLRFLAVLCVVLLGVNVTLGVMLYREKKASAEAAAEEEALQEALESVEAIPSLAQNSRNSSCFYTDDNGFYAYNDGSVESVPGIDVSEHQGTIDWEKVANAGVEFAVIRACYRGYTNGELKQDLYFEENIAGAKAAGLKVGIYVYSQAIDSDEAREEAEMVLDLIEDYEIDYPVYFDWEPVLNDGSRTQTFNISDITSAAMQFCTLVESAGYRAGVYFNLSQTANTYFMPELGNYAFWLADYASAPSYDYEVGMWQYSYQGEVDGIGTTVDLNMAFAPISE